ncbi:response regulator [Halomonas denitrificans]|nr:response regulator [Halomonas denitrificans]
MGTGIGSGVRDASALASLRVLAVDDHPVNRAFLRALLRHRVAHLCLVDSGARAIEACSTERFDLVLLDLHMPDFDGFSTWDVLRRSAEAPVAIALTADARDASRRQAEEAGFGGYLEKPATPDVLLDTLVRVAGGQRVFERPLPAGGMAPLLDDRHGLDALGTRDRLDSLRAAFADELADGLAPLEQALTDGRMDRVRDCLHQWIGASGYVGADRLARAAGRLRTALVAPGADAVGIRYLQFRRCAEATVTAMRLTRSA